MGKRTIKSYFKPRRTRGRRARSLKSYQSTDPVPTYTKKEQEIKTLRQFDLNLIYGPCIGISRSERWHRAAKFGLSPPQEVIDLINKHLDEEEYTECFWNEYILLR